MNCIKCGKDTKSEHIFCQQCLDGMDKYPVKPDVHVQLPNRPATPSQKRSGKKRILLTTDEQVVALQKRTRRMAVWIAMLCLLLGAAAATIVHILQIEGVLELVKRG